MGSQATNIIDTLLMAGCWGTCCLLKYSHRDTKTNFLHSTYVAAANVL